MALIQITNEDGKKHWINPDYVIYVRKQFGNESGSVIFMNGGIKIITKEEPNEIAIEINGL